MKTIAVMGLGYVGLGLAVELCKSFRVIGYDISKARIEGLKKNHDRNTLFTQSELAECKIEYTDQLEDIKAANFYIVSVSTPAFYYELPNLQPLIKATEILATVIKKGDTIVFESTVYPGTTEEVCLPILEEISNLKSDTDFYLGYSPERINPNDKQHTLRNVPKIISGQNAKALEEVRSVYEKCCDVVYPVSNIKTAEAVKILENTQRDINIAIMNEFAEIMHALDINVHETIEAAKTKWSFVHFKPGFVGGHCISVDPLYLAFKAKRAGVDHDLIITARKINDNITRFIVRELVRLMILNHLSIIDSRIGIYGITYKENVPDVRNSLALKLVKELKSTGFICEVNDPFADKKLLAKKYDIELREVDDMKNLTASIIVVAHDFYQQQGLTTLLNKMHGTKIIMDIPSLFIDHAKNIKNLVYWSL